MQKLLLDTSQFKELQSIFTTQNKSNLVETVDAKKVYEFLDIKSEFSHWIKRAIENAGLTESIDYVTSVTTSNLTPRSNLLKTSKSYFLSIDSVKILSMMASSEKGKLVRYYFLDCEKIALDKVRDNTSWLMYRKNGKLTRRNETDAIQQYLLPLVRKNSPESSYCSNPALAYVNYTKLINKQLGLLKVNRDDLSLQYLQFIEQLERIISAEIKLGYRDSFHYKQIYKNAAERVKQAITFMQIHEVPMLLSDEEKQLLSK